MSTLFLFLTHSLSGSLGYEIQRLTHINPQLMRWIFHATSSLAETKQKKKSEKQVFLVKPILLFFFVFLNQQKKSVIHLCQIFYTWEETQILGLNSSQIQEGVGKHSSEPLVLLHREDVYTSLCMCMSSGLSRVMHFFHYPHQINVKHSSIYCACATAVHECVCLCERVCDTIVNNQSISQYLISQKVGQQV